MNPVPPRRSRFVLTSLSIAIAHGFVSSGYCGSIHFDGSVGSAGVLNGPNFIIPADRGKQVGGNLFHSFSDFNLIKDDIATFQGPSNVQNILARVTGGGASGIDGTLRSEISGANLYFINPAGVMFGANAKLDISGSFAVTTADYLQFGDGARFHAQPTSTDSLTSAPVSAFGFLNSRAAHVRFDGSRIATSAGNDLSIVAGKITLDAATIAAPSGRLALVSTAAAGRVPIVPGELPDARGAITLKNKSSANINGPGGGSVVIRGGKLQVTGASRVESENDGPVRGGNIDVRLAAKLTLQDGYILSRTVGSGAGGNIRVRGHELAMTDGGAIFATTFVRGDSGSVHVSTDTLRIDGTDQTSSTGILADVFGIGHGGDIFVQSTDLSISGGGAIEARNFGHGDAGDLFVQSNDLSISGGGRIDASTFIDGDAGTVNVSASRLRIDGRGSDFFTGISSNVIEGAVAHGGNVTVRSDDLAITNRGQIAAHTAGDGDAGNIVVQAGRMVVDGPSVVIGAITGIQAITEGKGSGGNITVNATVSLELLGAGQFAANTYGTGIGSDIVVRAPRILISGANSGLYAVSGHVIDLFGDLDFGPAGDVTVRTGDLTIEGGGFIATSTFTRGASGDVLVMANHVLIQDPSAVPFIEAGITASSFNVLSGGPAGGVKLRANTLTLLNGGAIGTFTQNNAPAGDVNVAAGSVFISGDGSSARTGIIADTGLAPFLSSFAMSRPGGRGGTVHLSSAVLDIRSGAEISASTSSGGDGGSIDVSSDRISISGEGAAARTGIFSTSADGRFAGGGSGGDVRIHSRQMDIRAGGLVSAATEGMGKGGSVEVTADGVAITGSGEISATTFGHGDGGTVLVDATHLRITGSDPKDPGGIFASSRTGFGAGGSILVRSDALDLAGAGAVIEAAAFDLGASGSVRIESGSVLLHDGASVSVLSTRSSAGSIDIAARERIELHGGSSITASAAADGGSIFIKARDLFYLDHSSVVATAGTVLALGGVGSEAAASGGDITVDPTFIILDHATISANAALGRGGNILLVADNFFSSSSALTATGSTSGTVEIAAPELDLAASLVILPGALVDASTQLRELCAHRLGLDFSSFLVIGRGGVSLSPDEPLPASPPGRTRKDER